MLLGWRAWSWLRAGACSLCDICTASSYRRHLVAANALQGALALPLHSLLAILFENLFGMRLAVLSLTAVGKTA